MHDFSWQFPYPSQRMPLLASSAVATSQPLAAQAGLKMLQQGGNAVDAALATAIALTVVEPTSNGIGSDAFALVWDGRQLHGFNGSGRSPQALTRERLAQQAEMPQRGWDTVTVPGAVDTWAQLWRRFGRLPFTELFAPAIDYAQKGFLVSPITAAAWTSAAKTFHDFPTFGKTFLRNGRAPQPGERYHLPDHARTLGQIAASEGEAFYRGALAQQIAAHAAATGGLLTDRDLAAHQGEWVAPIGINFHGRQLLEIPPNGQGLAALIALGILRHLPLERYAPDSADHIHLQLEAMKIAFAEAHAHVADPRHMPVTASTFLDEAFLAARAAAIDLSRAARPVSQIPAYGGTVYLTTADADGMMVSFIQSNYMGFGSGIVVPGTGIALQNRGAGFVLEEGHPNVVGGGKRPFHTIIPGFVMDGGQPLMSFGVMGGHMQPQGHVQMMLRIFQQGLNPQAALDAPRWHVTRDYRVALESGYAPDLRGELQARGHELIDNPHLFGGGQIIYRLADGYCAASDPRKDGQAVGI